MANYGKRMVPEYLIKGLEEAYAKTSGGTGSTINLMENIVDSEGNKRFIEGVNTINAIEGVNVTYNKWSLSGTHLMIVIAGTIANGTVVTNKKLCDVDVPKWIKDKVIPLAGTRVDFKGFAAYTNDLSATQSFTLNLGKYLDDFNITFAAATANNNYQFRFQFDCLIDSE